MNPVSLSRLVLLLLLITTPHVAANELIQLTKDGRMKASPCFRTADEVIFVDFEKPTLTIIKRLVLKTGETRPLHKGVTKQELEPSVSVDGEHCVYIQCTGGVQTGVFIRDEKNNTTITIPPDPGFCGYRSPTFSPDNKLVAFSFANNAQQNLFVVDRYGKNRRQLTKDSQLNLWPDFSPDGQRIVFGSTRDGNFEIYSMKADGSDVVRLTESRFQDVRPRFSPDGKQIAFTSTRHGNHEIYLMNQDGSNVRRLTKNEERDDYPDWHPDGDKLIFVSEREGSHDLYLVPIK